MAAFSDTYIAYTTGSNSGDVYSLDDDIKSYVKRAQRSTYVESLIEYRIPSKLPAEARTLELPDGAKLIVDDRGNYHIDDKDAKVIYQANRMREFSSHLNASDMVAEFVRYVGSLGVRKRDVLHLPIHLFISWLIIEAAERDGDAVPGDVVPVANDGALVEAVRPRCLYCGKFVRRLHYRHRFPFCSPDHAGRYLQHNQAG